FRFSFYPKQVVMSIITFFDILSFLYCVKGTGLHTVSTVEAVLLLNNERLGRHIDTFLGTFGITDTAAVTAVRDKISSRLLCLLLPRPKNKGIPINGLYRQVKKFSGSLCYLKHFQSPPALFLGIDFCHVWILPENLFQFFRADL